MMVKMIGVDALMTFLEGRIVQSKGGHTHPSLRFSDKVSLSPLDFIPIPLMGN